MFILTFVWSYNRFYNETCEILEFDENNLVVDSLCCMLYHQLLINVGLYYNLTHEYFDSNSYSQGHSVSARAINFTLLIQCHENKQQNWFLFDKKKLCFHVCDEAIDEFRDKNEIFFVQKQIEK